LSSLSEGTTAAMTPKRRRNVKSIKTSKVYCYRIRISKAPNNHKLRLDRK
jgi:hypothetical protein